MFYKYNQITQSVGTASQDVSMAQSLNQKAAQPLEIQYEYNTTKPQSLRTSTKPQVGYLFPNNARYRRLMDLQSKFSAADGKLVWQKLPKDMPLYYTTVALVVVGFGLTVYSLKQLAAPPKND